VTGKNDVLNINGLRTVRQEGSDWLVRAGTFSLAEALLVVTNWRERTVGQRSADHT